MRPRDFRHARKLTLDQMAALVDVSPAYVSLLETGKRTPSAAVAQRYADLSRGRVKLADFPALEKGGR